MNSVWEASKLCMMYFLSLTCIHLTIILNQFPKLEIRNMYLKAAAYHFTEDTAKKQQDDCDHNNPSCWKFMPQLVSKCWCLMLVWQNRLHCHQQSSASNCHNKSWLPPSKPTSEVQLVYFSGAVMEANLLASVTDSLPTTVYMLSATHYFNYTYNPQPSPRCKSATHPWLPITGSGTKKWRSVKWTGLYHHSCGGHNKTGMAKEFRECQQWQPPIVTNCLNFLVVMLWNIKQI